MFNNHFNPFQYLSSYFTPNYTSFCYKETPNLSAHKKSDIPLYSPSKHFSNKENNEALARQSIGNWPKALNQIHGMEAFNLGIVTKTAVHLDHGMWFAYAVWHSPSSQYDGVRHTGYLERQ